MNYTTYYLSRYPLFFILIKLFLFSSCTEELDDCFFLMQEKVNSQFELASFSGIKSTLKGTYTFKQVDEHKIEISGHPRYID